MKYAINLETMLLDINYIYRKDIKRRSQLFAYITYTRPLNDNI